MAKICPNCNLKHQSHAQKCVQCGAELEVIKSHAKRKRILIICIISALLIGIIVGSILFFTGPKAKVRSIMRALKKGDMEKVVETFPDFLLQSDDLDDYLKYQLPQLVKSFSEYKFSYNIQEVNDPSTKDKQNALDHMDTLHKYGYDPLKLQDIKVAYFTIKGVSPGKWGSSFNKFILIKYDGAWYWWPFYYGD